MVDKKKHKGTFFMVNKNDILCNGWLKFTYEEASHAKNSANDH